MYMFSILVLLAVVSITLSQVTYTTVPNTDSGPAYVFADKGTLNVSIYCKVNNNGTSCNKMAN